MASPFWSVATLAETEPPLKLAEAPEEGAVKVTTTPAAGQLPVAVLSSTWASRLVAKGSPTLADWGVPATAVMV